MRFGRLGLGTTARLRHARFAHDVSAVPSPGNSGRPLEYRDQLRVTTLDLHLSLAYTLLRGERVRTARVPRT